jgi:hypothetical protein
MIRYKIYAMHRKNTYRETKATQLNIYNKNISVVAARIELDVLQVMSLMIYH